VNLVALFSPEHGIEGVADDHVLDSRDSAGITIFSLYGNTKRPTPEQLKNVDVLVYDIQDIGSRFYTYISTLGYAMEAAAKAHLPFLVLDRPNPIGGIDIEGPIADSDKLSFIAYYRIPVRHGMTVGELAKFYNQQLKLGCDLHVVKMVGWKRKMWFDGTNLIWVNPSPNIRSLTQAALYPGIGLLETTNVSVGRGTDTPFEIIGAPWLEGQRLSAYLNNRGIHGVRFLPIRFTPRSSVFKGQSLGGINIIITNRRWFRPVRTGLEIAAALRKLYRLQWHVEGYLQLLVNSDAFKRLERGDDPRSIVKSWDRSLTRFRRARASVLLYR